MRKPEIPVDEKIRARMKAIAALRGVSLQSLAAVAMEEWLSQQPELKEPIRCS